MAEKKRYLEIDIYRGCAILLIMFGHSFCEFPVDIRGEFESLNLFIGSFNMSMFFWISGMLFSVKDNWGVFFEKKFKRLMLPWAIFTLFAILLRTVSGSFTHSQTGSVLHEIILAITTAKYYWFLYALFLMMLVTRAIKNKYALAIVGGGILSLSVIGIETQWNTLFITRLMYYYPWFIMGFLLKDSYKDVSEFVENHIKITSCISIIIFTLVAFLYFMGVIPVIPYLTSILLCVTLWVMAKWLATIKKDERFFVWFGKFSLQYYLNHLLIIMGCYYVGARCFAISPLLALIVVFGSCVLISTIMILVERKLSFLRRISGLSDKDSL